MFATKVKGKCPSGKKNAELMLKKLWTVHRKVRETKPERLGKQKKQNCQVYMLTRTPFTGPGKSEKNHGCNHRKAFLEAITKSIKKTCLIHRWQSVNKRAVNGQSCLNKPYKVHDKLQHVSVNN